jgi:adenylosuccinate lyase
VNPIDFENSEGNLGLANAILDHMASKLQVSRWQRDLSDSTVLRNIGAAFGHCLVAYEATLKGLGRLEVNAPVIAADLMNRWEVLAEAVQTVMRRHGCPEPYEQLKALTRGQQMDEALYREVLAGLDIPDDARRELEALTPSTYVGLAPVLARTT